MPQPLARIYGSHATASAVVKQLHERGISADSTKLIAGSHTDSLAAIKEAGVPSDHAKVYAEAIARGEALVLVTPHFGYAKAATDVLDSHHPIAVELPVVHAAAKPAAAAVSTKWDSATPLSSWFGWKVLSDNPTPLSNLLGWTVLKTNVGSSTTVESIRRQSNEPGPFSRMLGWPLLSNKPAPLSDKLGWQVTSSKAAPLSDKLGLRVLSHDPTPLSTKLGWPTLSK